MSDKTTSSISVRRLRIGVLMLLVWWIPVWLLAPIFTKILHDIGIDLSVAQVTIIIAIIQTIIGLFGAWLAGPQIVSIVRKQSFKKAPNVMWHILVSGHIKP